jgi:hypothetical protein
MVFEQSFFETIDETLASNILYILKICQKWAHFIRIVKLYKFIENTLKIDNNGRNFNIVKKGYKCCNK